MKSSVVNPAKFRKFISLLLVVLLVAMIPVAFAYAKSDNPAKGPPEKGAKGDTIPLYVYVNGLGEEHDYNDKDQVTVLKVIYSDVDGDGSLEPENVWYEWDEYEFLNGVATYTFLVPFGEFATIFAAEETDYEITFDPADTIDITRFNKGVLFKECSVTYSYIGPIS